MDLKKIAAKALKKKAEGVVGENLPVQPALMVKLMGSKRKLAAVAAAIAALIAAVSELM
jgi:hypothetical protein